MFGLQEKYENAALAVIAPEKLGIGLLESRLKEIGLYLTEKQSLELKEHFKDPKTETILFDFSDEQLLQTKFSENELENELEIVMEKVLLDLKSLEEKLPTIYYELMEKLKGEYTDSLYEELEDDKQRMLEDESIMIREFSQNLSKLWEKPLSLLQTIIVITRDTGNNYLYGNFHNVSSMDLTESLLVRIHARAIQVSKEVLVLLKNGLADGAEARWRTLHELTVIATFIAEHGDEVAKRYIDHENIENYKRAKQHNQYNIRLGASPIDLEEMKLLEEEYIKVIEKYGENYKSDYGWASEVLNNKRPTFSAIELSVQFDHYRPYYKLASGNVHAGSHSIFSRLGLLNKDENKDILLCGYSNNGLAVAGQSTALSLVQITTSMLTYNSTMDSLVVCEILRMYADKTNEAFAEVENMMFDYSED